MTNIPTELLRTLVAVVDLRSFTKAANALGITQPAVSAQIKRLQMLLGGELFDKSAPGVMLTEKGKAVVEYARKLLVVNDQIMGLTAGRPAKNCLVVGMPHDYFEPQILLGIKTFRASYPDIGVHVRCANSDNLFRDLRQGEIDLAVAMTDGTVPQAYCSWTEQLGWVAADPSFFDLDPLPLVVLGAESLTYRIALAALDQVNRSYESVYVGRSMAGAFAAVEACFGVLPINVRWLPPHPQLYTSNTLPTPPDFYGGIYVREGNDRAVLESLAAMIAAEIDIKNGAPSAT